MGVSADGLGIFRLTEAALRSHRKGHDAESNHGTRGDGAPLHGTGPPMPHMTAFARNQWYS